MNSSLILRILAHTHLLLLLTLVLSKTAVASIITPTFINEIHYDNVGGDTQEFIEIVTANDTNLLGWSLALYNGSTGTQYKTVNLMGSNITSRYADHVSFYSFDISGIQNGVRDGIALINPFNTVVQFISYEGILTALGGLADGISSTDIGVFEDSTTPIGYSLQLSGKGRNYEDFSWNWAARSTKGTINHHQLFIAPQLLAPLSVPEPNNMVILMCAAIVFIRRKLINKAG